MKRPHFELVCEKFNINQFAPNNSAWIDMYVTMNISSLRVKNIGAGRAIIVGCSNLTYGLLFDHLPQQVANEIIKYFEETEIVFL